MLAAALWKTIGSRPGRSRNSPTEAEARPNSSVTFQLRLPGYFWWSSDHVRAGDAALVDRGGPDGVDDALAGEEVVRLGAVAGGVDVRDVRLLVLVGDDAAGGLYAGVLQEVDVRPHAGAADDHVGVEGLAAAQSHPVAAVPTLNG